MKLGKFASHKAVFALCFVAAAAYVTLSQSAGDSSGQQLTTAQNPFQLVQHRECSQRVGPYATQSTAWQRWREAQSLGYTVSNGVVPCYAGSTRGYCFFAFVRC